ncbi:MAG: hypothetical protein ACT4PZ_21720 [Panacagrimonas sp.]
MTEAFNHIVDLVDIFLDEEDRGALDQACHLAATTTPLDLDALLHRVQEARADKTLKAEALRRLRAALNLPAMPGPVCRPTPFD